MQSAVTPWVRGVLLLVALALAGCETRSISNSGYPHSASNPLYRGELTEFDVIGIELAGAASEADIAAALNDRKPVKIHRGATVMVVQSGALVPDAPIIDALDRYVTAMPFSGVPVTASRGGMDFRADTAGKAEPHLARALRLAAAKGGVETIICYWGVLESERQGEVTKAVSWVPIIGSVIPDETQRMRIRLKVAVVDVRSGNWTMLMPESFNDQSVSNGLRREHSDQDQVAELKEKAYRQAAATIAARFIE